MLRPLPQHKPSLKTLEEPTLLVTSLGGPAVLVEQTEHTLLGFVAPASQILQSLAAGSLLAPADNTAVLVLNEVGLVEAAGSLLRGTVEHLGLRAYIHGILGHYTISVDFYLTS
jgi:hypothetical protein